MGNKKITPTQVQEVGMLLALACLLCALLLKNPLYTKLAAGLLLLNILFPKVFTPAAVLWFGFAELLGAVTSKILLSLAFFLIVFPVGWFRRLLHHDSLDLKKFKKGKESVMKNINRSFEPADLEKPY